MGPGPSPRWRREGDLVAAFFQGAAACTESAGLYKITGVGSFEFCGMQVRASMTDQTEVQYWGAPAWGGLKGFLPY